MQLVALKGDLREGLEDTSEVGCVPNRAKKSVKVEWVFDWSSDVYV